MTPTPAHRRPRAVALAFVAFVLLLLPMAAWPTSLGSLNFASSAKSAALTRVMSTAPSFYHSVGGVAFSAAAKGANGEVVTGLFYDASAPDGSRLRVTLREPSGAVTVVVAPVRDWQLAPIARFADSKYQAAVTMFGSLLDASADATVKAKGGKVISYHPAFEGQLLGLRLLQLDMLILTVDCADLPKGDDGRYILGPGEKAPDLFANAARYMAVAEWLSTQSPMFQSYVVGDKGRSVRFSAVDGRLALTGDPYWDAWIGGPVDVNAIASEAKRRLLVEVQADAARMSETQLAAKYTETYVDDRAQALAMRLAEEGVGQTVTGLPELGKGISDRVRSAEGINPAVYEAGRNTMRYSALFRHFKSRDPASWAAFVSSLAYVRGLPTTTPTVIESWGQ